MTRWKHWASIMAIFAAAVFGAAFLGKIGTRTANIEAAIAIAAGTAAIAAMTRRASAFPRWASIASAAVLAVAAIGGAALWPDVAGWRHVASDSLWMHPWYFLTLAGVQPGRVCCAGSQASGWAIFIGALAIAAVIPLIAVLP